jgi:hypothetical protein
MACGHDVMLDMPEELTAEVVGASRYVTSAGA